MRCDQCVSCYINGMFCHEHGCPNIKKFYDPDEERWVSEDRYIDLTIESDSAVYVGPNVILNEIKMIDLIGVTHEAVSARK